MDLRFSQRFYDEPYLLRGVPPCTAAHPCFQKFLFQSGRFPNPNVEFLDGACLLYVVDIETGEGYWISGLKKAESNRHWAGHGKIMIDRRAVDEYLSIIGESKLPSSIFEITDIEDNFPIERANSLLNEKSGR